MLAARPVALDHPVADRERREERDLLRRDRRDEALERARRERRPEALELRDQVDDGRVGRPAVEGVEVERQAEEHGDLASIAASSGSTRTPPGAASIRTSRPPTTRWSAALVPEVREVGAERPEPLGRDLEVVRLRDREERHASVEARPHLAERVVEALVGDSLGRQVLGEPVAREDALGAASAAQRSE